jgi:hypothetical protein
VARLILNHPEVIRTAHNKALPKVNRFLRQSQTISRRTAPVGGSDPRNPRPTGARLRTSLKIVGPRATTNRIAGKMGSSLVYAATVSLGSHAHVIRARRAKTLRFYWNRVGHVVYPVKVNHPGNRHANRYMQRAGRVAAFVNGFKWRVRRI